MKKLKELIYRFAEWWVSGLPTEEEAKAFKKAQFKRVAKYKKIRSKYDSGDIDSFNGA